MPSKLSDESNLHFLYACLSASDYSRIDFARVAKAFAIQSPAARMRFARLKTTLGESTKVRARDARASKKRRKLDGVGKHAKQGLRVGCGYGKQDDDDDDDDVLAGKTQYSWLSDGVRIKKEELQDEDSGGYQQPGLSSFAQHLPPPVVHDGLPALQHLPYWPYAPAAHAAVSPRWVRADMEPEQ